MKERTRPYLSYDVLEVERDSLLSNLDSVGPQDQFEHDMGSRNILLFRYPHQKRPLKASS
ncbi:MAG: hypothetical protein MUC62_08755 [Candidatus Thermoplasmatota archaeon]|nr:hypothetical protein [Candidatus Thermoplasmatota archaeon]